MWTTKLMVDGVWRGDVASTPALEAKLAAHAGIFQGQVTPDGAGPHPARAGRYHLYVSLACPFAHRALLVRALKRLEPVIGVSVLHPRWNTPLGWRFGDTALSTVDHATGAAGLHELYRLARPDYTGRVTVPVLWDREAGTIVSNDSAAIMAMLNGTFDRVGGDAAVDLYPGPQRPAIDALNREIVDAIATGVYRVGGAEAQEAYEAAVWRLFAALDGLEARLADGRSFLHGERLTASDIVLFPPLVRLDAVYHPLFRASLRRLGSYPRLSAWLHRVHAVPNVAGTVRLDHVLAHYYDGWAPANHRIVPIPPEDGILAIGRPGG
jgi:putative glutathione S-transferase